jgi:hypothetical protein
VNTETNDLSLDLERCHKIQEIMNLLEQLMATENRGTANYIQIRHTFLDAADHLYKASLSYLEIIERRKAGLELP